MALGGGVSAWLAYAGVGAFAGLLAGLFGVGGGLVIVPVLALLFARSGFAPELIMHLAIGTSLATIVLTSLSSVYAHHRRGAVQWPLVGQLAPGILLGAWLGAALADQLASEWLQVIFGVFELLVALQMGLNLRVSPHRGLPGRVGMGMAGGIIGTLSALVGIGGGTMTVPFLHWCNVAMRHAVATSAACGLPIALAGTAGYIVSGWETPGLPPLSSGYLYWPAFAGIVLASVLFAPLGARLAHSLPSGHLKRVFALFLALLGGRMLLG